MKQLIVLFLTLSYFGGIMADEEKYKMELSEEQIRAKLDDLQYRVTRQDGTEPPNSNKYVNNKKEGIYVDPLSGEPLFSSTHKFDSGTGWPSFYRAIDDKYIVKKKDYKLIWPRTEIRSKIGDNHLGHLFKDAPQTPTGLRYCMNSASLLFIPKEDMKAKGYEKYLSLFEGQKQNKDDEI